MRNCRDAVNEVTALVSAWQAGAISQDTMFELFRRSEILPDGRKNEEEAALVKRAMPAQKAVPSNNANDTNGKKAGMVNAN